MSLLTVIETPIGRTAEALGELEAKWRALEGRAAAPFFLSWAWIGRWVSQVEADLVLAEMTEPGGEVVGLGVLHRRTVVRRGVLPVRMVFLHQTGDAEEDVITVEHNGPLAVAGREGEALNALIVHLDKADSWDEFQLGGIDGGAIDGAEIGALTPHVFAHHPSYVVDLAPLRAESRDYLETLSANTRRQIRRAMTLYEEDGPLRLSRADTVAEALSFFDRATALHEAKWRAQGRPGARSHPFYMSFNRRLIEDCFANGHVDLLRLAAGGREIGYLYNFVYGDRAYFYLSGLVAETDNRLKPGLVAHALAVERYLDQGLQVYDFLAGEARYKRSLGAFDCDMRTVRLQKKRLGLQLEWAGRRLKRLWAKPAPSDDR